MQVVKEHLWDKVQVRPVGQKMVKRVREESVCMGKGGRDYDINDFSDKKNVQCSTKMGVVDRESDGPENVCCEKGGANDEINARCRARRYARKQEYGACKKAMHHLIREHPTPPSQPLPAPTPPLPPS